MADQWNNGIDEAIKRLRQQVDHEPGKPFPRFDARDRSALGFVLAACEPWTEWLVDAALNGSFDEPDCYWEISRHATREEAEAAEKAIRDAQRIGDNVWYRVVEIVHDPLVRVR